MRHPSRICLFAIVLTAIAGVATAGDVESERAADRTRVGYGDLDLSSENGAQAMLIRIERAAKKVCGKPTGSRVLPREDAQIAACRQRTVENAVMALDAASVTFRRRNVIGGEFASR